MDFSNLPVEKHGDDWIVRIPGDKSLAMRGSTPEDAKSKMVTYLNHLGAMLELYSKFIKRGDICFDVGANKGERTVLFRKLGAKVIAVEPQSANVKLLENIFKDYNDVVILPFALGEKEGETEIFIASEDTVSSLSRKWIDTVMESGRFNNVKWRGKETIRMTTLDNLIQTYGVPAFIKIDVEGYEEYVIQGLSIPAGVISLEFVPEYLSSAVNGIRHLASLGKIETNLSFGESMILEWEKWIFPEKLIEFLEGLDKKKLLWGDVYIRFL